MKSWYASPLRVYFVLASLAAAGIFSGMNLPISLFPNSSKPKIYSGMSYGSLNAKEFQRIYGNDIENQLRSIRNKDVHVERVETSYEPSQIEFDIIFDWGSDPLLAKQEVERVMSTWSARFPEEIRDSVWTWLDNKNSGFIAVSFYSQQRSLDELYDIVESSLRAPIAKVDDADHPGVWNPAQKEVRIELKPDVMASLQLLPSDVDSSLRKSLVGLDGGSMTVGSNQFRIQMLRPVNTINEIERVPLVSPTGRIVHLKDIAHIDFGPQMRSSRVIKTSGSPSVILYSVPKPGGNVKKMAEDLIQVVEETKKQWPKDIEYKTLVDPSEFIRSAIQNVFHEVGIGSLLAVSVLFIFIGSLKNVATAAIEIPLSLVLAFIMMRLFGVNLNLISLGGLALSAGMNVDASVVVMENIFRKFESYEHKKLSFGEKLEIVNIAVKEVRMPIIASTLASLVVFVPLLMTSGLSYGILGDLAKAVIFSHGFSALVALLLVPTVRLQIMKSESVIKPHSSMFDPVLSKIESFYSGVLGKLIARPKAQLIMVISLVAALALLFIFALPRLPQEVIGRPDSDMIFLEVDTKGNTLIRQMESQSDIVEKTLLDEFSDKIQYTFTQVHNPNGAWILAKLKHKKEMNETWKALEKKFTDTPLLKYSIEPWNPSELRIPDPPDFLISMVGGKVETRRDLALDLSDYIQSKHIYSRVDTKPSLERSHGLFLEPNLDQWAALARDQRRLSVSDLSDLSRVATEGRKIGQIPIRDRDVDINIVFPQSYVGTPEDLAALPVGIAGKIVPLKSLLTIRSGEVEPMVYHENGTEKFQVSARYSKTEKPSRKQDPSALLKEWQDHRSKKEESEAPTIIVEDAGKDISSAIEQLGLAIAASVFLIFIVLLLQFGSFVESLIVLVAVPTGFIGVLASLFIFRSSLSLNSTLGVILLNGIAVNNSIILVDFIKRLWEQGYSPFDAAVTAAKQRLRPILITSLTTILGMLPIALGFGEGGKILQPLGVAVSGGLWISMLLTLLLVPALHAAYLAKFAKHKEVA